MIALMTISLCALCWCLLLPGLPRSGPIPSAGSTPVNSGSVGADPRGELIKAMRAMLAARSYRSRTVSSGSSGISSSTVLEFVAPDRFHVSREAETLGRGAMKPETIVIGKDTWIKMGGAPWQRSPANLGDLITQLRNPKVVEELAQATGVEFIGPDVLDGSPTMLYQYTLSGSGGKGFKNTVKTWVGVADGLSRRTEGDADIVNITGKEVHTKSTTTYSAYGAEIMVEPPI